MNKTSENITKRKPGRPPTFREATKVISVIMPLSMVKTIERDGPNISETIRDILSLHYDNKITND